jgi:hypothetical protein
MCHCITQRFKFPNFPTYLCDAPYLTPWFYLFLINIIIGRGALYIPNAVMHSISPTCSSLCDMQLFDLLSRLGLWFSHRSALVCRCVTQRFKFPTTSMRCSYLYFVYLCPQCRKQGCCRNVYMNGYHRQLLIKLSALYFPPHLCDAVICISSICVHKQCRKQGCCCNVYMNGYHRQLLFKLFI